MTFRRRLRWMRRRAARALRPSRLLASLFVVVALAAAVSLLVLVVSQNAPNAGSGSATPAPTTTPKAAAPTGTTPTSVPSTTPPSRTPKAQTPLTQRPKSNPPPVAQTVPLGVYAGPGAPIAAAAFSADAGAPVPYAFDYIDGSSWDSIANPMWFVERWSGSGFRMIWGVPMLPLSGATLAAGAAGEYDAYFSQLASTLVDHGQGNSIIMLGWDPEDQTLPWSVATSQGAAQYIAYWRQIVTSMRTVAGQQFEFAWDSAPGTDPVLPPALYPGNAYVDIVATDAFDAGSTAVGLGWNAYAASPYGPNWFAGFAFRHDRPLMIAKWGVVPRSQAGGGDSAVFVSQFLQWAGRKHLFIAVTWDYGSWAVTGGEFPRAAAALRTVAASGVVVPIGHAVDT